MTSVGSLLLEHWWRPVRISFQDENMIVIDQFLSAGQFDTVSKGFASEAFKFVHVPERQSVFRQGDGMPLDGSATVKVTGALSQYLPAGRVRPSDQELPFYLFPA